MFMTVSKTIGKVGGFRIGIGKRITSKNAWWLCIVLCFVVIFQIMWYMLVLSFWLCYAMLYGMWWCCKKLYQLIVHCIQKRKGKHNLVDNSTQYSNIHSFKIIEEAQHCPICGAEYIKGNTFCIKCGSRRE